METIFFLILASLLQGLLEWLPVSSEGQNVLILISLLGDPDFALSLSLFLHLGTCFSVLFYYRHLVIKLTITRSTDQSTTDLRRILFFVTLGTGCSGFVLYKYLLKFIGIFPGSIIMALVGIFLILTAGILYFTRRIRVRREIHQFSNSMAFFLGLIQGIAILPGISRSGLTIATLLWLGTDQEKSLFLSYLMSIPASLGVVFLEAVTETLPPLLIWEVLLTLTLTFITGYFSMGFLLRISRQIYFYKFCLLLGLISLLNIHF